MIEDKELDALILNALLELWERKEPTFASVGLCANVAALIPSVSDATIYTRLYQLYEGWPHHSGYVCYPVREDKDYGHWEGPNGEARWNLVSFLINKLMEQNHD